jgi:hypothetical protein
VTVAANARWRWSRKTLVRANAGYMVRTYETADERNFSGPVGSIRAIWDATGKTRLEFAVWQEISNLGDEVPNYAIIDGISLEPKWQATAKTAFRGVASYERRDFQRVPEGALSLMLPERIDKVGALGIWLDWQPRRNVSLAVGVNVESRNSTESVWDYDDQNVQARFSIGL